MPEKSKDPRKFGEGLNRFSSYLKALYSTLDDSISSIGREEGHDQIEAYHMEYKSALSKGSTDLKNSISTLYKIIEARTKVKPEEHKKAFAEAYTAVIKLAGGLYGLLDPEIDSSSLIENLYSSKLKINKNIFKRGSNILKYYYLLEEQIEMIKKAVKKRKGEAEAARRKRAAPVPA
jgi:hypothetical protein